jgi:16S rRNA G966 N2-methylase RsmD
MTKPTPQRTVQAELALRGKPTTCREYKPFVPGPNPELPDFIKQHSTPYDPTTDEYDVPAFDRDIVVDKSAKPKAIYDMHTYWSKKHWAAIREYIHHYLPEKYYPKGTGLVLDCFSGSGMTGVAAMMEDRPCILVDASPAAAFISHCYIHPVDSDELQKAYDKMMAEPYPDDLKKKLKKVAKRDIVSLQQELDWLYETKCDRCGGPATTEYIVYSEQFQCPRCGKVVALSDCPEVKVPYLMGGKKRQIIEQKDRRVCPHCWKTYGKPDQAFVISPRAKHFGATPVLVNYLCLGKCSPKGSERRHDEPRSSRKGRVFEECDVAAIAALDTATIPHWYPKRWMMDVQDDRKPWGVKWRAGTSNFRTVADLYTRRNLWALASIVDAADRLAVGDAFRVAVVGMALGASRMNRYVPGHWSLQNRIMAGTYYVPQVSAAVNIRPQFMNRFASVRAANAALFADSTNAVAVTNDSAKRHLFPERSIDYLFTDPPYVGKIQYGELNFVWESWLGIDGGWRSDEIIVNPFRGKSLNDWDKDIRAFLANCFAALKPGRWLSLCYHDTDADTWARIQNALLDTGFEIHTVTVLDPKQKSLNQLFAEKVVKSDLVLNCRKNRDGEGRGPRDEGGQVSGRVRDILVDTLSTLGGQPRDRLWDIVLKRLLTRGQMAEHRFDDILAEVASKSESGRWFLKEEFESLSQNDIRNEEEAGAALERFTRLRCVGVPVAFAAQISLGSPRMADHDVDEDQLTQHIRGLIKSPAENQKFRLGGRMAGVEFYDCLFFYLTRYLKGRPAGKTPRRNMADFLEEYLVRFRDGDRWLYRPPDEIEATSLKKSRQSGLGRRIRQYAAFVRGEGEFPKERLPDVKTLAAWLKHCANFGLADEGVALYEKGGLMGQTTQFTDDERFDAEDYYAQCRRNATKAAESEDDEGSAEESVAE